MYLYCNHFYIMNSCFTMNPEYVHSEDCAYISIFLKEGLDFFVVCVVLDLAVVHSSFHCVPCLDTVSF